MELLAKSVEMSTEVWADIFAQAAALGVLQLHLSGGEPASRTDLVDLVAAARDAGLYTNLITSGIRKNACARWKLRGSTMCNFHCRV
jgi:pyrroloquinoline quinone biosynthesis protein E